MMFPHSLLPVTINPEYARAGGLQTEIRKRLLNYLKKQIFCYNFTMC